MICESSKPRNENNALNSGTVREINPAITKIKPAIRNSLASSLSNYFSNHFYNIKLITIPLSTSFPVSQIHRLAAAGQEMRVKKDLWALCISTRLAIPPQVTIFGVFV